MVALKGQCSVSCKGDKRSCWHLDCKILRRFKSGKFLIENRYNYVRAAVPADLLFSISEERDYSQYNVTVDELELEAETDRENIRQTGLHKLRNSFRVQLN